MKVLQQQITETSYSTIRYWFEILSKKETYSVWLEYSGKDLLNHSCSCRFGSFEKFSKKNEGKYCRHIKECIKYKNESSKII